MNKSLELNFGPSCTAISSSYVYKHIKSYLKQNIILHSGWARKLSSKLSFSSSPNTDGFYTFYISHGSVATQLRCGNMFSDHFATNFSHNATVKKF